MRTVPAHEMALLPTLSRPSYLANRANVETKVPAAAPCRPYVRRRPGRHPRRLPVAGCQPGRSAAPGAGDHGDAYVTQHGGHVVSRGMHLKRQVCPKRRTHFKIL